jgi:hypothetical protein
MTKWVSYRVVVDTHSSDDNVPTGHTEQEEPNPPQPEIKQDLFIGGDPL